MAKKTPPYPNYPKWTSSRFWSFIRSALRAAWMRYPVKYEVFDRAFVKRTINPKSGKMAKMYLCKNCLGLFSATDIQIDHRVPIGELRKYEDLPQFVERLFCSAEELDCLCKKCHSEKTKLERANARISR